MSKNVNKLLLLIVIVLFPFALFSCKKIDDKSTGNDIKQIENAFPKITGIVSCEWTYGEISKNSRLSVGPDAYSFYGHIVLDDNYFQEIETKYKWEEFKDVTLIDFIDKISSEKVLYGNEKFNEDITNVAYSKFLLDKASKTIYFYQESI